VLAADEASTYASEQTGLGTGSAMVRATESAWLTLRRRALVALGVLGVLLPALGGIWGISQARRALTERIEQGQLAVAAALASQVEQSADAAGDVVRSAARRPSVAAAASTRDVRAARALLPDILETAPLLRSIMVFDRTGRQLALYPQPLAITPQGLATSAAEQIFPAMPYRGDALVVVREPITSAGKVVGFLVGEISLSKVSPSVLQLRLGRTGEATLIDARGDVLVTADPRRFGSTVLVAEVQRLVAAFRPGNAEYFSSFARRTEIAAFSPLASHPWGILVTEARSEALAPTAGSVRLLVLGLVVLVALGASIAWLVSQSLVRLERRMTERIAEQQRLNRALEGFSRHVAHDLRTPIAVIGLAAQTVEREAGSLSENARKAAGMLGRQAERASQLIEDLLDLARASGTPRLEALELDALVDEAARDIVGVRLEVKRPLPKVVVDRAAMRQAIANLFQNASRYARTNGVADVTVSCAESEDGWTLAVSDRGPGLPEGGATKLFEPFMRGMQRSTEDGSGLGLAIVAATAHAHGGRAWYEPRQGGGSVFNVFIPRGPAAPSPPSTGDGAA